MNSSAASVIILVFPGGRACRHNCSAEGCPAPQGRAKEATMMMRYIVFAGSALAIALLNGTNVQALTMKECSDKYKAAQADGTARNVKWNDFRKANCGPGAPNT